ncbi:hypothetical protein [Vallitalea guaymasensis]|nr:hypothetical protein [Vallitalea guaymasensis]
MVIEYQEFTLKTGYSIAVYDTVIMEYDKLKKEIAKIELIKTGAND